MSISIIIDELTECLVRRCNGETVQTKYVKIQKLTGKVKWQFDWGNSKKKGYDIYELYILNSPIPQGRISFREDEGFVDIDIAESAPHNVGHLGEYIGVGGHLFAIACKFSFDKGFNGYVAFTAKTKLVNHYIETLQAQQLSDQRMFIDTEAASILVDKYLR
ncbi:MAG: hypothetical protein PHE09_14215 [Oscillospiraceae bacterium]|nr:hypothetical protein [Oscillospiraceae bacterium]